MQSFGKMFFESFLGRKARGGIIVIYIICQ